MRKLNFVGCEGKLYVTFEHTLINPMCWVSDGFCFYSFDGDMEIKYVLMEDIRSYYAKELKYAAEPKEIELYLLILKNIDDYLAYFNSNF